MTGTPGPAGRRAAPQGCGRAPRTATQPARRTWPARPIGISTMTSISASRRAPSAAVVAVPVAQLVDRAAVVADPVRRGLDARRRSASAGRRRSGGSRSGRGLARRADASAIATGGISPNPRCESLAQAAQIDRHVATSRVARTRSRPLAPDGTAVDARTDYLSRSGPASTACAAASRATGTRNGEHET